MFRIAMGQVDAQVGDIDGNVERVLTQWRDAAEQGADVIVFTELTITGYPPEDLLLKREFIRDNLAALQYLAAHGPAGTVAIVGYVGDGGSATDEEHWDVTVSARNLHNSAAVIADGQIVASYNKWRLPNYGVFDEARYFIADDDPLVVTIAGIAVGITVCEDLWVEEGPLTQSALAGAQVIANLNASPYHRGKRDERERWVRHHATQDGAFVVYVNVVGGQDEVVFDGDSMLCSPSGSILARGAQFEVDLVIVDIDVEPAPTSLALALPGGRRDRPALPRPTIAPRLDPVAEVYAALVRATRDYCHRNGFTEAVLGLSGGIDSAVVGAIAADALGPQNVLGVAMPSPYSSDHSISDARLLADNLGMRYDLIAIEPGMDAVATMLKGQFAGTEPDVAEENIQARLRGLLLMGLSNKFGSILLTTGNKSEYAVGYATLYGDMAGGFAPLKDVPKMLVYDLARYRAGIGPSVPLGSITKPPSAELRPDQLDQDSLPPYDILDGIVEAYALDDNGVEAIVAQGFDEPTVRRIVGLIDRAEYKRRQSAPGPKVTSRAFGKERRVPITSAWRS